MPTLIDMDALPPEGIGREIARERQQRVRNDELRSGTAPLDDLRSKDVRQRTDISGVRRPHGRDRN